MTPSSSREVGGDARVAARAGHHRDARPERRAAPRRAGHGERLRQLEQLVRVARPRGAGLLDQRAEDPLVAGDRAGVRLRRGGARLRGAGLQHRDADPGARAALERRAPALAVAVGLEVERDRAHAVELGDRVEPVRRLEHRLVAARDDRVQPQAAARGERVDGDVAALRDQRDRPGLARRDHVAPERHPRGQRDDPVAVRPADRQVVARAPPRRARPAARRRRPTPRSPPRTRRRRRSRARRSPRRRPGRRPRGSRRRRRRPPRAGRRRVGTHGIPVHLLAAAGSRRRRCPGNPSRRRFSSASPPYEPGRSVAPTTAIERGCSSRPASIVSASE